MSGNSRLLTSLALLSAGIYGGLAWLSRWFEYDSVRVDRPIIAVLVLFGTAFAIYALAIRIATRSENKRPLLGIIIVAAVAFRLILLWSVPIQEVDIYRYIWDGAVANQGISPFRYPPAAALVADPTYSPDPQLQQLAELRDGTPALAEVLRRVHFSELPTVYPLVSQAVFAAAHATTPPQASVTARLTIMKAWLIAFDLGTLLLVIRLLNLCQLPIGLSIVYAWCPLVIKEIANSGHLDSIAVFLTTLAVYCLARVIAAKTDRRRVTPHLAFAALIAAMAVGAKLYAVVLVPLFVLVAAKRFGWVKLIIPGIVYAATAWLLLRPMLPVHAPVATADRIPPPTDTRTLEPWTSASDTPGNAADSGGSPPPGAAPNSGQQFDPSLGLSMFLRSWEMNDFIFMILVENLKPSDTLPSDYEIWFSVVPDNVRLAIIDPAAELLSLPREEVPFAVTRLITMIVFLAIAIGLAWRAGNRQTPAALCEAAFLTVAWFWLLLPTQNPWYWVWALPLVPFARNRAWLIVSGLVLIYYLRFWLDYHYANRLVLGTTYHGASFFDFVVTWLEYLPFYLWLLSRNEARVFRSRQVAFTGLRNR